MKTNPTGFGQGGSLFGSKPNDGKVMFNTPASGGTFGGVKLPTQEAKPAPQTTGSLFGAAPKTGGLFSNLGKKEDDKPKENEE